MNALRIVRIDPHDLVAADRRGGLPLRAGRSGESRDEGHGRRKEEQVAMHVRSLEMRAT